MSAVSKYQGVPKWGWSYNELYLHFSIFTLSCLPSESSKRTVSELVISHIPWALLSSWVPPTSQRFWDNGTGARPGYLGLTAMGFGHAVTRTTVSGRSGAVPTFRGPPRTLSKAPAYWIDSQIRPSDLGMYSCFTRFLKVCKFSSETR